jgi:hypothetical protein
MTSEGPRPNSIPAPRTSANPPAAPPTPPPDPDSEPGPAAGPTPPKRPAARASSAAPTNLFARLLGEAGISDTRFARGVNDRARRVRRVELGLARTTIGHWRRGMRPRDPMVAEVAAAELTAAVGYPVTPSDLGWRGEAPNGDELGLALAEEPRQTLLTIAGLSGRDMRRRDLLRDSSAFIATAFADPVLASLTGVINAVTGEATGSMNATMIRDMTETFRRLDARYGSGEIRGQVVAFLHDRVRCAQDGRNGPDLFSALAELTQFGGWLAQDADRQALAQRYYIQALGLAEHAGDGMIAGRVLAAMSDQSARLGQLRSSVALARAALDRIHARSSPAVRAMLHDKHAWALARVGDAAGCERALAAMEDAIASTAGEPNPSWAAHYNPADAAECRGHCMLLLHRHEASERSLIKSRSGQSRDRTRTRSYAEADLALGYLRRREPDLEAALDAARRATSLAGDLRSRRVSEKLTEVDRQFATFADVAGVREWRETARQLRDTG